MSNPSSLASNAFQTFMSEAPQHAQAWGAMVQGLATANVLDKKTSALAYLAVLAALRVGSGSLSRAGSQASRRFACGGHQRHPDRLARCGSWRHAGLAGDHCSL